MLFVSRRISRGAHARYLRVVTALDLKPVCLSKASFWATTDWLVPVVWHAVISARIAKAFAIPLIHQNAKSVEQCALD